MSVAKVILEEEVNNLRRQIERNKKEIEKLPQGSIRVKVINNNEYSYLQFREVDKVKSIMIKKDDDLESIKFKVKRRKQLEKINKQMQHEVDIIMKTLKKIKN